MTTETLTREELVRLHTLANVRMSDMESNKSMTAERDDVRRSNINYYNEIRIIRDKLDRMIDAAQ